MKKFKSPTKMFNEMEKELNAKSWYKKILLLFVWDFLEPLWKLISPIRNSLRLKYFYQRITRGFDDRITWSLDYEIAKWMLPRLIRFKELKSGIPGGLPGQLSYEEEDKLTESERDKNYKKLEEEWNSILCKIILAFQLVLKDSWKDKKEEAQIKDGMRLFAKYYRGLWH